MAHYITADMYGSQVECHSAGLYADAGMPATKLAQQVLAEQYHIDLQTHVSQQLRQLDLSKYDFVVCLDRNVFDHLHQQLPAHRLLDWHVDDPYYSRSYAVYADCAAQIKQRVQQFGRRHGLVVVAK